MPGLTATVVTIAVGLASPTPLQPVQADGQAWAEIAVARTVLGDGCPTLDISYKRLTGGRFGESVVGSCAITIHEPFARATRRGRGRIRRVGLWWECTVTGHEYGHAIGLEHDAIEAHREALEDACEQWALTVPLRRTQVR